MHRRPARRVDGHRREGGQAATRQSGRAQSGCLAVAAARHALRGAAVEAAERVAEAEDDDAVGDREERLGRTVKPVGVRERDAVQRPGADRRRDGAKDKGEEESQAEGHARRRAHRWVRQPVEHGEPRKQRRAK